MQFMRFADSFRTLGLNTVRDRLLAILIVALLPAGLLAFQSARDILARRERLFDQIVMDQAMTAIQAETRAVDLARGMLIAISPNAVSDPKNCPVNLEQIRTTLPDILSLAVWNEEGAQICGSPQVTRPVLLSQSFPELLALMRDRKSTMAGYVSRNFSGYPVVFVAEPRFDDRGRLIGASSLGYSVDGVLQRLAKGQQGYAFSVALVDSSGLIVARKGTFENQSLPSRSLLRANMGAEAQGFRDRDHAYALVPYHHPDLYVLVHADLPDGQWGDRITAGLSVAAPVLMMILTLVLVWVATDYLLVRPLAAVTRTATAYVARERPAPVPEIAAAPEEIRRLDESLRTMADVLVGREQVLSQALDDEKALLRELHHRVKNNLQMII
ncbi:MAG: hypothetical protein ACK41P_08415, partial [Asticcacaulis sp.]